MGLDDNTEGEQALPRQDRFSDTIPYAEREAVLDGPTPIIIKAIADTLIDSGNPNLIKDVIQQTYTAAPKDGSYKVISEFKDCLSGTKEPGLAFFTEGKEIEYLSIVCAFINGARKVRTQSGGEEIFKKLLDTFSSKSYEMLKNRDGAIKGINAAQKIIKNFDGDPQY